MPEISWSVIDNNFNSKGYLDSVEVENARKKGIKNVFVGMIQQDYEGTLDMDEIIEKYNYGAYGRIPMFISSDQLSHVEKLYREHIVLKCKLENLKAEFKEKCGLLDEAKSFFSKFGLCNEPKEYMSYKKKITEMQLKVAEKEHELASTVDLYLYGRTAKNFERDDMNTLAFYAR